jgi:hypothetical protein
MNREFRPKTRVMTERNPFEDPRTEPVRTKASLRGPNVTNTFDTPLRPDALEVQKAAIRKHLHERRLDGPRPSSP